MSYKRFCGLANATNVPDRTTVWTFENRIDEAGAKALFDGVSAQLLAVEALAPYRLRTNWSTGESLEVDVEGVLRSIPVIGEPQSLETDARLLRNLN